MGDRSAEMLNIMIAVVCIIALFSLGFAIFTISKRMAYDENNQLVEQIITANGTTEEIVLVAEDGKVVQKSAKPEFKFDMRVFGFVAYTKLFSIGCFLLALASLVLVVDRLRYIKRDNMWEFKNMSDYYEYCDLHSLRCCEVPNYIKGDMVLLCNDTPAIGLFDYLFRVKQRAIKAYAFAVKSGSIYDINGNIEDAGMYYKVQQYYIPKNEMYLKVGEQTNIKIYADDRSTLKVNNQYILRKFKVID